MNLQRKVFLNSYSNYRIGGPANFFVEVSSPLELTEALTFAQKQNLKIFVLGKGTKVLIRDKGFDGLVIYNKIEKIEKNGEGIKVGSGTLIKDILNYCIENSLSGLEWAGGLPGTIGGAVRGNSGAFGGEAKDNVVLVESLNLKKLGKKTRNNRECRFGYRDSVFKSGDGSNEFIIYVVLKLIPGNKEKIKENIQQKINYRLNRQPMDYPSIGSTFKNIPLDSLPEKLQKEFANFVKNDPFPVVLVTKLLALCDLKGKRVGDAMISEKHPNFIINVGKATEKDVSSLIEIVKETVKKKYNILLEEEIIYLN